MALAVDSLSAVSAQWVRAAPADAGFAPDLEARLDKLIADKRAWKLRGAVVGNRPPGAGALFRG